MGYAWAGAVTFCMIPYSVVVVFPTVGRIERVRGRVEKEGTVGQGEREVEEVMGLLRRWNGQHVVRGLMPLVGAVVGMGALTGVL